MKPSMIEFQVGKDIYGRAVTLRWQADGDRQSWCISVPPWAQNDHCFMICGLSVEVLRCIAAVVEASEELRACEEPSK